jgi:hypothetical protein
MKREMKSIVLILCALIAFTGCKQIILGTVPPADKRVQLIQGGPQSGRWKTFDFAMDYTYLFTQTADGDFGSLELSASLEKTARRLDRLSIRIYLLNADGEVIEVKRLYDSGYKDPGYMERSMGRTLTLRLVTPPETAAITFAHTATESSSHR